MTNTRHTRRAFPTTIRIKIENRGLANGIHTAEHVGHRKNGVKDPGMYRFTAAGMDWYIHIDYIVDGSAKGVTFTD